MARLLELLNNTFIGTLSAGLILALTGFALYKKQKKIDVEFEILRKLRDTAATLFSIINSATGKICGLFNMYDQQNPILTKILQNVGSLVANELNQKIGKELEESSSEITTLAESLTSQLAIKNNFEVKVDIISQNILKLNLYLQGASITIHKLKPDEVKQWREGWDSARIAIVNELNKVLK